MNPIQEFIKNFDINNPDWGSLPDGFPDCSLSGCSSSEVGRFNAICGLWEVYKPKRPRDARSRTWGDPEGYRHLIPWSNTVLLRHFVRETTSSLPKSEYRRKAQLDDAARSVVRNMEEGYKRATTSEYLDFIGYS